MMQSFSTGPYLTTMTGLTAVYSMCNGVANSIANRCLPYHPARPIPRPGAKRVMKAFTYMRSEADCI